MAVEHKESSGIEEPTLKDSYGLSYLPFFSIKVE